VLPNGHKDGGRESGLKMIEQRNISPQRSQIVQ